MRARATRGVTLVLDENLSGKSILAALAAANVPARSQTDYFPRGTPDTEAFSSLAQHLDCYLLTKDKKFHRTPAESEALQKHGIGAFVITAQKGKSGQALAELIQAAWPRIQRFALDNERPFIAKILADGRVERVM